MAHGAVAFKNLRPAEQRILANHLARPLRRNPRRCQLNRSFGFHLGLREFLGEILRLLRAAAEAHRVRRRRIVGHRQDRQRSGAEQQPADHENAEVMPELPHPPISQQRQDREQQERAVRNRDSADQNLRPLEILEELEQEEKVPFGPSRIALSIRIGGRVEVGASAFLAGMRPAFVQADFLAGFRGGSVDLGPVTAEHDQRQHDAEDDEANDQIAEGLIGPEPTGAGCVGRRGYAVPTEGHKMQHDHRDHADRQNPDMEREEPRQRVVAVSRIADQEPLHRFADARQTARDVGRHLRGEEALLIPGQQIAGEAEAERRAQQADAEPPVDLARRQMRARDHHLQHVQGKQHDHRLRAEMMQAADQPAEVHLVLDEVDRPPRRDVAGRIGGHQQHAGDDLDGEDEREAASPDIAPFRAAGDLLDEHQVQELLVAGSMIQPVRKSANHVMIPLLVPTTIVLITLRVMIRDRVAACSPRPRSTGGSGSKWVRPLR